MSLMSERPKLQAIESNSSALNSTAAAAWRGRSDVTAQTSEGPGALEQAFRDVNTAGPDVRAALAQATAGGQRIRVSRVAASGNITAAQIDDEDGTPYMISFWELRNARIAQDISIVLSNTSDAS